MYIPNKRARVLELWNIEMLHQGREKHPQKVFRMFENEKIQKIRPDESKSKNKKQQRKKQKD